MFLERVKPRAFSIHAQGPARVPEAQNVQRARRPTLPRCAASGAAAPPLEPPDPTEGGHVEPIWGAWRRSPGAERSAPRASGRGSGPGARRTRAPAVPRRGIHRSRAYRARRLPQSQAPLRGDDPRVTDGGRGEKYRAGHWRGGDHGMMTHRPTLQRGPTHELRGRGRTRRTP